MKPPSTGNGDGEIWSAFYALRERVQELEVRDEYATREMQDLRDELEALLLSRKEERDAILKMLYGALLGLLGVLYGIVKPKLGL